MKKGLFTLIAGYAAGLAIAMKYRKDAKVATETPKTKGEASKSKVDEFIDEVVDLHKTAYADIKSAVSDTLGEIKDFDELKQKVNEFITTFKTEFDAKVAFISAEGNEKIDQLTKTLEELYGKKQELLKNAGEKARSISNISGEAIDLLILEARARLTESYKKIKEELDIK